VIPTSRPHQQVIYANLYVQGKVRYISSGAQLSIRKSNHGAKPSSAVTVYLAVKQSVKTQQTPRTTHNTTTTTRSTETYLYFSNVTFRYESLSGSSNRPIATRIMANHAGCTGNTQPLPGGGFGAQPAFRQSPFSATSPTLCPKAIPPGYPPKPTVRRDPTPALEKLDIGTTKNQPLPCSVELSPRADMIVALYQQDRDSIKYAVESNILRLASPVFRAMLGDNFREGAELVSSRNELYTLELPEDDAKAMCTLLCILHHTSRQVPTAISQSELLHIAITLEKYDCYEALFPWTQLWLPWAKTIEDDNDALLIAWSFRDKALFEVISRVLILECPTTPDGTIITKSGGPFHETVPESVLGK